MRNFIFTGLILLFSITVSGQNFELVDENGKTLYIDKPIPHDFFKERQRLNLKPSPLAGSNDTSNSKKLAEEKLEFDELKHNDNNHRSWRPWICAYSNKRIKTKEGSLKTDFGLIQFTDHVICTLATDTRRPEDPIHEANIDAYLALIEMSRFSAHREQLGAVLCHDGAVGSVTLSKGLPTIGEIRAACTTPTVPARISGGSGGRESSILPNLFGNPSGIPLSSDIKCSSLGSTNPWAKATSDSKHSGTSDADIAYSFLKNWLIGVTAAAGMTMGGLQGGIVGSVKAAGGAVGFNTWTQALGDSLGELTQGRYVTQSQSLAFQAESFAQEAEASAQAAEAAAAASGTASGNAESAKEAAKARAAAIAARKAAEATKLAAKLAEEAKTLVDARAAYEAAKKATEDAKKKAEEAAKAREEAKKKALQVNHEEPVNPGESPSSGTPIATAESTCESLRRQTWECEQSGWKTFSCQELVRKFQGCQIDMTVALVDGDSAVCGIPTISSKEVAEFDKTSCGMLVAYPMPGMDPCALTVEGSPELRGSCDPTKAYNGCPKQPDVVVPKDDTVCFPAPPGAPPIPCVDPTPGGGPVIGGFLQDSLGGVYVVSSGGFVAIGQGYPPRFTAD